MAKRRYSRRHDRSDNRDRIRRYHDYNYETKFSLSGTSLEGVSTSAVTLDNFALVNSTANEAFFVSEVEFFAAPPSAIPEPDTLAIWGLMGLSAGAFGLRRKIRLRS